MDKYYSYTDFLRAVGQHNHKNQCEQLLSDIYLDLFLNRLQRLHRIEQLITLIDTSLDEKNERAFYEYATELQQLQEQPNEEDTTYLN